MNVSELPETARVKLTDESEKRLWGKIDDEEGGIKSFCRSSDFSSSKLYNWKNKDVFLPVKLVSELDLEELEIKAVKGKGRGGEVKDLDFGFPELDELLTRIQESVAVNSNGTPMYQTDDIGNAERFAELLENVGSFSFKVYSRESYYQINYPKFVHKVLKEKDFDQDLAALVDEKADIQQGLFVLEDRSIRIQDCGLDLYSREKFMRKALMEGDQEAVQSVIASEAERADRFIENI
jgi:hypothetical protein